MKPNSIEGDTTMNLVKQYLGQILDLGDTALSALAGAIYSRIDGLPRLDPNSKGLPVMYATIDGVPYEFSRRTASIVVHAGHYRMTMGEVSESASLSYI